MGKKSHKKQASTAAAAAASAVPAAQIGGGGGGAAMMTKDTVRRLPVLKRIELNQLIDRLLQLGFQPTTTLPEQWQQYVEIQTVLARVQSIEAELKVKPPRGSRGRATYIDNFTEWARANGAEFDGIEIAEFPQYELGLVATRPLASGDQFIQIPIEMVMSLDNVSPTLAPMMAQLPMIESMLNVKLAFSLLVERLNPNSFWRPYIDILPDRYATVMSFSVHDMQELKGSSAQSLALAQCKNIARHYAFINKFIQGVREEQCNDPVLLMLKDKFTYDLYW